MLTAGFGNEPTHGTFRIWTFEITFRILLFLYNIVKGNTAMSLNRRGLLVGGTGIAATLAATGTAFAQNAQTGQNAQTYNSYGSPATTVAQTGTLPDVEKKLDIVTLRDLEGEAQKVMAPFGFAYVAGGAGDEWTMRENLAAYNRWVIAPDYMSGHKTVDTTTKILGTELSYPVITAPMGNQGSVQAKLEAPVVKGTALAGTLFVESSVSQMSMEDIAAAANGPKWFQIYVPESRPFAAEMLHRAKAAGYAAIVVTVDATIFSNRERTTRLLGAPLPNLPMGNSPRTPGVTGSATAAKVDLNWDDVEYCHKESGLPVIVKSILSAKQALEAERRGCSAVWLSNHGGRQLDNVPSALTVLPSVALALKGRIPIIVDGGVFRGQDVFRAIALGASVVALGRPVLYGSALGGSLGVQSVHEHLKEELVMVMQLAGTPTISSITRDSVARADLEA
jgi:isopentenyl diphosphate isomerase/L-lactate dehydrogenase-like FMN-dependent dehydrogenase